MKIWHPSGLSPIRPGDVTWEIQWTLLKKHCLRQIQINRMKTLGKCSNDSDTKYWEWKWFWQLDYITKR
jgi:hypothetical protein